MRIYVLTRRGAIDHDRVNRLQKQWALSVQSKYCEAPNDEAAWREVKI